MKKKTLWWKVVIIIVVIEVLIGGVFFAYKKLKEDPNYQISTKDKTVQALYQLISYENDAFLDIKSKEAISYYSYQNIAQKDTINCEVVEIAEATDGYHCEGLAPFVKKSDLIKKAKEIYGEEITTDISSFPVDANHYAYYDEANKGMVVFTKEETVAEETFNFKLTKAEKKEADLILTVEVLDGILGTEKAKYRYTFTLNKDKYHLTQKEKIAE